jgi:hypothetical protein
MEVIEVTWQEQFSWTGSSENHIGLSLRETREEPPQEELKHTLVLL